MTRRVEVCWVPSGIPEQDERCEKAAALAARLWEVPSPTVLQPESSGRANALLPHVSPTWQPPSEHVMARCSAGSSATRTM